MRFEERLNNGARELLLDDVKRRISQTWSEIDHPRPTEPELTAETKSVLSTQLPETGWGDRITLEVASKVLDQSLAQSRPRFLAYIGSSGLEIGAVADFLAASYDFNLAIDSKAASLLEQQTARWLGQFVGFHNAEGLFTSGGTVSNLTALAAARQRVDPDARKLGNSKKLTVYCSVESHYSNTRAVELLGLGSNSMRAIGVDGNRRMRTDLLRAQIQQDLADGFTPMAIIATAGTTLTGAVDPMSQIADLADEFGVWLHVDGAYGAPAAGTVTGAPLFDGIDRAHSVTIDAHKWMFVPKACSVLLVKDLSVLQSTFGHDEAYMPHDTQAANPVDLTLEYSRPLRALKLWMALAAFGAEGFRAALESNLDLAQYCYSIASSRGNFRVLDNRPQLSVVPIQLQHADSAKTSKLNQLLTEAVVQDGRFFLSEAQIDGETWLRPCFTNFRTTREDVDDLFEVLEEVAKSINL
jgi:aromatic-L-amino-acid decarboxylase